MNERPDRSTEHPYSVPLADGKTLDGFLATHDAWEIAELLNTTTRNPHTCISKGQLKTLAESVIAKNWVLAREVDRLQALLKEHAPFVLGA